MRPLMENRNESRFSLVEKAEAGLHLLAIVGTARLIVKAEFMRTFARRWGDQVRPRTGEHLIHLAEDRTSLE